MTNNWNIWNNALTNSRNLQWDRKEERRWKKKKKNKPDIVELSSRPSFMKPSSLTPVYCIRLRSILPDIIRITLFMLSFIRAVFRQPHGGYIYREWGASGKRRRKETAPSTILTKQFKRWVVCPSSSCTCGKNRRRWPPMRQRGEGNGNSIRVREYTLRGWRTVNLPILYSIFSRL